MRGITYNQKLLFGLGQTAESIKNFAFGTLLLLYYNQVLGVSGSLSGIAVAIALGADAISDPAVGSFSDGFRHRLGRRHLFMFASIIPLGLCYFLLFWPPEGLSEFQLFLWLTVFAVLARTALTFFHVPYLAIGAEMTSDYQERTEISAIRAGIGMLGALVIVFATWNFIFVTTEAVPSPQLVRAPYFEFAVISSLIMMVFMLICAIGTLSLLPRLSQANSDHPSFSLKRVYLDIFEALKNRAFLALFLGSLIFAVYVGVHASLAMHTKTFFWQLSTAGIEYVQYAAIAGGLFGLAFLGLFHRVFDKRMTLIIGVFVYSITSTLPIVLEMMGFMPADPITLQWALVVAQAAGYFGILHAGVSGVSMMGDIADEHELVHGRRQEGVYFGSHNFALKCSTAAGALIGGLALDFVDFPVNAIPGEVSAATLFDYGLVNVGLVVMAVVGVWVFWPYNMSRVRHQSIMQKLDETRELPAD